MTLFLTIVSCSPDRGLRRCHPIGFRDRSYAIPAAALGLNFAWETVYAARSVATGISTQGVFDSRGHSPTS